MKLIFTLLIVFLYINVFCQQNLNRQDSLNNTNLFISLQVLNTPKDSISNILFEEGRNDAKINYKGIQTKNTNLIFTSIFSFAYGFIPLVITSNTGIQPTNLNFPDYKKINDPSYYQGYILEAKKIKKKKSFNGYLIGSCINISLVGCILGGLKIAGKI